MTIGTIRLKGLLSISMLLLAILSIFSAAITLAGTSETVDESAIIALIKSFADRETRDEAVKTLKEIGESAVPLLIKIVGDTNEKRGIRINAVYILADIGKSSPETIPALIKALGDENSRFSSVAADTLGQMGKSSDKAIAALIRAMEHEEKRMRANASDGLVSARRHAVPTLMESLHDESGLLRVHAIVTLKIIRSRLDRPSADATEELKQEITDVLIKNIPELIELLGHSNPDVRSEAAEGLGLFGKSAREAVPMLIKALNDKDVTVRLEAVTSLRKTDESSEETIYALIKLLKNYDEDDSVRCDAAQTLGVIGKDSKEAINALIEVLDDRYIHPGLPACAAKALGKIGAVEAAPALIDLTKDAIGRNDGWSSRNAREALEKIGTPILPDLLKFFRESKEPKILSDLLWTLKNIEGAVKYAEPALVELMSSKDVHKRDMDKRTGYWDTHGPSPSGAYYRFTVSYSTSISYGFAQTLGSIGRSILPRMMELLNDKNPLARAGAITALSVVGDSDKDLISDPIAPLLIKALDDEDNRVRSSAALALGELRKSVGKALPIFDEAIPGLVKAYKDEDYNVRAGAARALFHIGTPTELVPELARGLYAGNNEDREYALRALGGIGEEALPILIKVLSYPVRDEDDLFIYTKSFHLGLINSRHYELALSALIEAMDDEEERLRVRATAYLWSYAGHTYLREQNFAARAVPILIEALNHEDPDIREHAIMALGEMVAGRFHFSHIVGDDALDMEPTLRQDSICALTMTLEDADERVRRTAIMVFSCMDKSAGDAAITPALMELLNRTEYPAAVASALTGAKGRRGKPAKDVMPALIESLDYVEEPGRVAMVLARVGESGKETVDALLEAFSDESIESGFRTDVAETLGEILEDGNSLSGDITAALIKALNDEDIEVRASAAKALKHGDEEQSVPALTKALRDEEWSVRAWAANGLSVTGEYAREVVPALIQTLDDENKHVRGAVVKALGRTEASEAVSVLVKTLDDETVEVREAAIKSLRQMSTSEAHEALMEYSDRVRAKHSTDEALKVVDKSVVAVLLKSLDNDNTVAKELAAKGKAVVPHLIEALGDEDDAVRNIAAFALEKMGKSAREAAPVLIRMIRDENEKELVRYRAARALGRIGGSAEEILSMLIRDLDNQDRKVRLRAIRIAWGLGEQGVPVLIQAIGHVTPGDDTRQVSQRAIGILLKMRSSAAQSALAEVLDDENHRVRIYAAWALSTGITDHGYRPENIETFAVRTVPDLIQALKHKDWDVREKAAKALGNIATGDIKLPEETVPQLIKSLDEEHVEVRNSAVWALGIMGESALEAAPMLIGMLCDSNEPFHVEDSFPVIQALGRLSESDKEVVSDLIDKLGDKNVRPHVREALFFTLGQIGSSVDKNVTPVFVEALDHEDKDVRGVAASALARRRLGRKIYVEKVVPELIRMLSDERWKIRAANALRRIGEHAQEAVPKLIEALNDENGEVRRAAARALRSIDTPEAREALENRGTD